MALPIINAPTYEVAVPSSKEKINYRPFLVKEEKILLLALEDGTAGALNVALKQIVNNCTYEKLDVSTMATFDLEFIFLRIRAKSVGEVSKLSLLAEDDGETYVEVEIPLEKIVVDFPKDHTNTVKLTDTIGVILRYPTYDTLAEMDDLPSEMSGVERVFTLMSKCVDRIFDAETVHERIDFNEEELETFLNSLSPQQFADVQKFFDTMPKLQHQVKFTNPKTKKKNTVTLEGLQSFFA